MVEEHDQIGRLLPMRWFGKPRRYEEGGVRIYSPNENMGARIYGPGGTLVEIGTPERTRTWSVCRKLFDEAIVARAISAGILSY